MTITTEHENGNSLQNGVIEWSVLDEILAFRKPGGPDPRRRIITIYLDSSPMLMEAIKTAISAPDTSLIHKSAHALKSSSMNVGAIGLGPLCADLERAGKAGSIEDAKNLFDRLETQYAAVIAALQEASQQMGIKKFRRELYEKENKPG
jgi:HPt (histidine-containing phosphotransfer) domain-containing protein